MKQALIILFICVSCLTAVNSGKTQNPPPGPISLEVVESTHGPFYTLDVVKLADTKPAKYTWLLQEQAYIPNTNISQLHTTSFNSLASPALRKFVSLLPPDAHFIYSRIQPVGDSAPQIQGLIGPEEGLQDFVQFCHKSKVKIEFGTTF